MDVLFTKGTKQTTIIILVLILIEIIGSVNGIINYYYYDYNVQSFTGIFESTFIRFLVRESLVYINAIIGFYTLYKLLDKQSVARLFILTTVFLDIFFVCSGLLRQIGLDNLSMNTAYANIFNIIGTGMLFLFFAIIPNKLE